VKFRASRSPLTYLGGLLALYLAIPIGAFLVRLAQPGDRGFGADGLWSALWTSVASATVSTAIVALLGIPLAYWLARTKGPLNWLVGLLVMLPIALPPVMSGLVLIYIVGPYTRLGTLFNDDLTGTVVGVVLAQTFVAGPFLVIAARAAFAGIDPALDDLAASLGRGPASRFWLVSMRIAAPGIRAGLLLTWLRAIGEYGATVLLAYHPYTLPVFVSVLFSSTGIPQTQAPTALAIAVAVAVLLLSEIRFGRRKRRAPALPAPAPPFPAEPVAVSFNLDLTVGTFRLRVAHQSASNRIAILGPSGAGKSITLRAIAGFLGPRAGTVEFNGDEVAGIRVEDRRVGYVPQGLVMFPGRTAWQQVLFAAGADPALAAWWLRTLRLDGLEGRLPGELSGGQRQRVGLARALSFRPRLVLLDEPFSALDAPVREELRRELRRLQREAGLSTVLVTHDPEEAALLADEILVVDDGRLLQAGPRAEVFARPASPQVARLLGIPNLIPATVTEPGVLLVGAPGTAPADGAVPAGGAAPGGGTGPGDAAGLLIAAETGGLPAGAEVLWTIRPDHITVLPGPLSPGSLSPGPLSLGTVSGGTAGGRETYPGVVDDVADIGTLTTLTVRLRTGQDQEPELRVRTTALVTVAPGDPCLVRLPPDDITAWPATQAPVAAGDGAGDPRASSASHTR
jgi:ABC-type sulfate/molybdate transport systems ATPase subunit/ABC-type sulfate transport system permease component